MSEHDGASPEPSQKTTIPALAQVQLVTANDTRPKGPWLRERGLDVLYTGMLGLLLTGVLGMYSQLSDHKVASTKELGELHSGVGQLAVRTTGLEQRLDRVETKLDKLTDAVAALAVSAARTEAKLDAVLSRLDTAHKPRGPR